MIASLDDVYSVIGSMMTMTMAMLLSKHVRHSVFYHVYWCWYATVIVQRCSVGKKKKNKKKSYQNCTVERMENYVSMKGIRWRMPRSLHDTNYTVVLMCMLLN